MHRPFWFPSIYCKALQFLLTVITAFFCEAVFKKAEHGPITVVQY